VHLVCDASHALLAASPARTQAWRRSAAELTGASLWPYASPEIQAVEARLPEVGWDDAEVGAVAFWTGPNAHPEVTIRPGVTLWERIRLQDGRDARLVTTVAAPPAHACWIEARA
jgi:hypothetical protein